MIGRSWILTAQDVELIALGAGVLGTGGGGNPYLGKLMVLQALRQGARLEIIPPDAVGDDDLLVAVSNMGAPTVGVEKLARGNEAYDAFVALERHLGEQAVAVVCGEIGGSNSMTPLRVAAQRGLPIVDADPMGRAFPELQMDTFSINGVSTTPAALSDEKGNTVIIAGSQDALWTERLGRMVTIAMGGSAGLAMPALRGRQLKAAGIWGSYTWAHRIGATLSAAREAKQRPEEALAPLGGRLLFRGKIVDVQRATSGGFARGMATMEGFAEYAGSTMRVAIQNENLIAWRDGAVVLSVPDLICILDADTGEPTGTETLRFGLRVCVVGFPADPKLTTKAALAVVGPGAFGYDIGYRGFA
jgi:DUF917 family protein